MITLHWYGETMTAAKAVRGADYVSLVDEENRETRRIINIRGAEWQHITLEGGGWTDPAEIPTEMDRLRADVDYLLMLEE